MGDQAYLKIIQTFIKSRPLDILRVILNISGNLAMQDSCMIII